MIFLSAVLFSLSLYFLLLEVFKIPKLKKVKAVSHIMGLKKNKFSFDNVIERYSCHIVKFVKLNAYTRQRLKVKIDSADIDQTPEEYIALAICKAGLFVLIAIVLAFVFPLLSPLALIESIAIFFSEYQRASKISKKKIEEIESELPRFTATIAQELKSTRDVTKILFNFKESVGGVLKKELNITVADMNSGNQETALLRLQTRVGSSMLSDIVRGLIAVIRGDNGVVYFEMLSRDMKKIELQKLKMIAVKRPLKMRKYSLLMLLCFISMYLVVLGYAIVSSFGKIF